MGNLIPELALPDTRMAGLPVSPAGSVAYAVAFGGLDITDLSAQYLVHVGDRRRATFVSIYIQSTRQTIQV
ncbi:hypothetical protein OAF75_00725 [Verrucomicrobiales bacterium]|nr:hypothetical protein [Verrucomicrobiales bacterium]MDB4737336.1 hypothetical protein [Verrucomicrobiales bacterium]MDB4783540.1 hypothetical protein [Verrucomicrobiales bacterium]